jgi:hypothetical protein
MSTSTLDMAASTFHTPVAAHKRLAYHYSHQTYPDKVDAAYVTRSCRALLDEVMDGRAAELLSNPNYASALLLSVASVRSGKRKGAAGGKWLVSFSLLAATPYREDAWPLRVVRVLQ